MQYRQGDVFLQRVSDLPKGMKKAPRKRGRYVLAEGEATGHAHTINYLAGVLFMDSVNRLFLRTDEGCTLEHQKHAPISVGPGSYQVIRQREYSPEAIRNVAD
jgi:hypothetical protein